MDGVQGRKGKRTDAESCISPNDFIMQASGSFEVTREGRGRPNNLFLSSSSGSSLNQQVALSSSSSAAVAAIARTPDHIRLSKSAAPNGNKGWVSPSFNPSLSLKHSSVENQSRGPANAAQEDDLFFARAGGSSAGQSANKIAGIRLAPGMPPTPITASNATFPENVLQHEDALKAEMRTTTDVKTAATPIQLPGVREMLAGPFGSPASPADSVLQTPASAAQSEYYARHTGVGSVGTSGSMVRSAGADGKSVFQLPPLKSPLDFKRRDAFPLDSTTRPSVLQSSSSANQWSPDTSRSGSTCSSSYASANNSAEKDSGSPYYYHDAGLAPASSAKSALSESSAGEFAGPRAEWTSPSKSHLFMDVRAPPAPAIVRSEESSKPAMSPSSWSRRPQDGDLVGLGFQMDVTPRSAQDGLATPTDSSTKPLGGRESHIAAGIPFMPPRLPGAPRLGFLQNGRFDSQPHHLGAQSPILSPLRSSTWNTDLRFDSAPFRAPPSPIAPASAPAGKTQFGPDVTVGDMLRAPAMERERTVQLDTDLPRAQGLGGLGIRLLGGSGSTTASGERTPIGTPTGGLTMHLSAMGTASPAETVTSSSPRQAVASTPSARTSPVHAALPFSASKTTGLTPTVKGVALGSNSASGSSSGSSPPANTVVPSPSLREQSKLRSRQLVQTATNAVAAVAAAQQHSYPAKTSPTDQGNFQASYSCSSAWPSEQDSSEVDCESSSDAASNSAAIDGIADADAPRIGSIDKATARAAAAELEEHQRAMADSSPWGVFSVTKAWKPLAPPGMSATAFVNQQKKNQKKSASPKAKSSAGGSLTQQARVKVVGSAPRAQVKIVTPAAAASSTAPPPSAVKKQKLVLGVKSPNTSANESIVDVSATKNIVSPIIKSTHAKSPRKRLREQSLNRHVA